MTMDASLRPIDAARSVNTRRDLLDFLSLGLQDEYRTRLENGDIRQVATFVKAYLMEAHEDAVLEHGQNSGLFRSMTTLADESLIRAETNEEQTYFFDISMPRFTIMHTIEKASHGDRLFQRLTNGTLPGVDRCWFPSQFLESLSIGVMTGFGMQFQPRGPVGFGDSVYSEEVDPETGEILEDEIASPGLRLSFSGGGRARSELNHLRRSEAFTGRRALSQIEVAMIDEEDPSDRLFDVIYSDGKIVGHGSGIQRHIGNGTSILQTYGEVLNAWEEKYAVEWKDNGSHHLFSGTPFLFWFPRGLGSGELTALIEFVFSSAPPFRLFGVPLAVNGDRVDVDAMDLHTGDRLRFEVTSEVIRLYLPSGTCANAVTRFWRNFETTLAAETDVLVGDDMQPLRSMITNAN